MEKRWIFKPIPSASEVETLASVLGVEPTVALLLVQRGVHTFDEAKSFFRPNLKELHDPFLMKGMTAAVTRLEDAMRKQEKVLIYGDYDVDGTTAVALVYGFLQGYYKHLDYYIPNRHKEGYGISKIAIDWAKQEGFSLIIALDCGIKSVELVAYAQNLGIDFIICDHHLPGEAIPPAYSVLDPKQADCHYPFKHLSGCGIGFKFVQAFCQHNGIEPSRLFEYMDLVVVSIAADIVPMVGENRILAYHGLQKLNHTPRVGLKALIQASGFKDELSLDIRNLVFSIGPRINAVGRMQHAKEAVELLISHEKSKADDFAKIIDQINQQRKEIDTASTQEALEMIEHLQQNGQATHTTVLFKADWHKGVLGIIAARCIEMHHRPTIILTQDEEDILVGSARSAGGFNLYEALEDCSDLLLKYGGHQQAAGLSMHKGNLEVFKMRFEEKVASLIKETQRTPQIEVDLKIKLSQITSKFFRILKQFAPFGPENMRPIFVTENLIAQYPRILREKHLSFQVKQEGSPLTFRVIAFGMADFYEALLQAKSVNICYSIEENLYQGKNYLQLRVRDLKFND